MSFSLPTPLVLASASPRRRQLLERILPSFLCHPADIEESYPADMPVDQVPEFLSCQKAQAVAELYPDAILLGSDTGVFLDNSMLGKPKNQEDAVHMLERLSGRTHRVITGCCLIWGTKYRSFSQTTQVTFYPLSQEEIRQYVATGEPLDKAGGYGIQGKGALLVKEIRGDYFKVVGLPVALLARELQAFTRDTE